MFYIDKDTPLTSELLLKFINRFIINEQPKLIKWEKYYRGKHDILTKNYTDTTKPCSRVVTNFCKVITDEYAGYIAGKPISYTSNDDITDVQDTINYNDAPSEDMRWLKNTLVYSAGYELFWIDASAQIRFSQVSPVTAFPIYDNSLDNEIMYFVRWYKANSFNDDNKYYLEVYDNETKKTYSMSGELGFIDFISAEPHFFKDVPISVFNLNEEEQNIFDCVMTLNDAYNELQSDSIDDYSSLVDSLLAIQGADLYEEDMVKMKENRLILLPEGASANYIVRNTSDIQVSNIADNIKSNIYKITAAPDMTDEKFLAQSGTALSYKLVGFENVSAAIVNNFKKAIQRRIELICNVLQIKASDAVWRDIDIVFNRNLPQDMDMIINTVEKLQGSVSNQTLLAQIPFISDVQSELEKLTNEKKQNMETFGFPIREEANSDEQLLD